MKVEIKITDETGNVQLYDVIPSLFTEEGIDKIFAFSDDVHYLGDFIDENNCKIMKEGAKILLQKILKNNVV